MKIAVLVKQVPSPESPLPLVSNEDWLDESQVAYIMNERDSYALEEAPPRHLHLDHKRLHLRNFLGV